MKMENIDDLTAFTNGDKFESDEEVNAYFTIENIVSLYTHPYNFKLNQSQLDNFAKLVIANKWHCNF